MVCGRESMNSAGQKASRVAVNKKELVPLGGGVALALKKTRQVESAHHPNQLERVRSEQHDTEHDTSR
jgi:hypothetical protein